MPEQHHPYYQLFRSYNVCVIVPTYNNGHTLAGVLNSLLDYTDAIIVVNDGSTDSTGSILANYPQITKIEYSRNKGKGSALREGFAYALQHGYDYAITIDSDGQHFAADLPSFLEHLADARDSLIIGSRNLQQKNMPGKNTFANRFSNFWFWVETGQKVPDTQSGYRLYPLYLMKNIGFFGTKYEFEVEVLVRCAWNGIKVRWIPINVYYPPAGERVSHFRPGPDFLRISLLNTILVLIALLYIKPRDLILKMSRIENVKEMLRKNLFNKEESIQRKAISIGFGIFMGIVPIWGFQMAVALLFAAIFRLNKALTIIASNISIPPMIPFIVFCSYMLGRVWMGPRAVNLIFSTHLTIKDMWLNLEQYIWGSITLAVVAGLAAYIVTWSVLQFSSKIAARRSAGTQ